MNDVLNEKRTISLTGPIPMGGGVYVVRAISKETGIVDFEFNSISEAVSFIDQRTAELLNLSINKRTSGCDSSGM